MNDSIRIELKQLSKHGVLWLISLCIT